MDQIRIQFQGSFVDNSKFEKICNRVSLGNEVVCFPRLMRLNVTSKVTAFEDPNTINFSA
jgi:hypothetical protein